MFGYLTTGKPTPAMRAGLGGQKKEGLEWR